MKRRYTAPTDSERCKADVRTTKTAKQADGSEGARCMRRATANGYCSAHRLPPTNHHSVDRGEMIAMRYEPEGLAKWATTDPSLHYNRIEPQPSGRWLGVWIYLLRVGDYEAAALVSRVNGGGEKP